MIRKRSTLRRKSVRRRHGRKKVYRRRTVGTREVSRVQKSIPDRLFVKLRYVDANIWTGVTNTSISNNYSYQSSIYRPRTDLSSHQPMWTDQYMPASL